jgi:hypothetical protein
MILRPASVPLRSAALIPPASGSANPQVERHSQTTIRATVSQRPFPMD